MLKIYAVDKNSLGIPDVESPLVPVIFFIAKTSSFLFRIWIYMIILAIGQFYLLLKKRRGLPALWVVIAVSMSGWLFEIAFFGIATTNDYRMGYWPVIAAITSMLGIFKIKQILAPVFVSVNALPSDEI